MHRILVVEEEKKISRFLQLELEHEGYGVGIAPDGRTGLEMALSGEYGLVLLDIMLPGLNGMEVCRRIRQSSQIPVIMVTAKDDVMDKVMGLDMGADDYITKPFAIEELLARIRRLLNRTGSQNDDKAKDNVFQKGNLAINTMSHEVSFAGEDISLTKKEYDLLLYLAINEGVALTREQILEKVWGYDFYGDTNIVDVYIRYLRSKIDQKFSKEYIHTLRGVGYMFRYEKD